MSAEHQTAGVTSPGRARSSRTEGMWAALHTHPLEIVLFTVAIVVLLVTVTVTARTALRSTVHAGDLTFEGALDELALVLSNGGPDRLARLNQATLPANGGVVVDTIAIVVNPADEPAAQRGGFIADQVALYNDHVIREALIRTTIRTGGVTIDLDPPSLLSAVRTETGERRLSRHPNPFVLTVRSPYAERAQRAVRTADWSSSGSLLGLLGDVPLERADSSGIPGSLNGRDCIARNSAERVLLYCTSAMASDVGRFYDIAFKMQKLNSVLMPARAFLYRPATLWVNGSQTQFFTSGPVNPGNVIDLARTGPFLVSAAQSGTLADEQWINGRPGYSNQRVGAISFFAAAGRSPTAAPSVGPLVLALDAAFSQDLESEARKYLEAHPAVRRMSVVVMDIRTGEIKAVAEPARRFDEQPLLAFEPILVGSVVKPLVAAAILSRRPQLAELRLEYAGDTVRTLANVPIERTFANAANGCVGSIALNDFIRCSSNQYAAELLVRSLRADGFQIASGNTIVPRGVLEQSAIGDGLAEAFDVDAYAQRTAGRNPGIWVATRRPSAVQTADRTLMPWESRPWLVFPNADGTRLDLLARYAFGGWENRWTLIGIGEAYGRIATGREVKATILDSSSETDSAPDNVAVAFKRIRAALREVPTAGTAAGLASDLRQVVDRDLAVLAKTGTLNEDGDRFRSLALVLGKASGAELSAELTCGLVAVSYFEFHDDIVPTQGAKTLPPSHLEFARGGFAKVMGRQWQRVSGCPVTAA